MRNVLKELLNAPGTNDKVSSSYLWFHLGNLAATVVFVRAGWAEAGGPSPNFEGLTLLMVVYLGLITGNKLAVKVLEYKTNLHTQPNPNAVPVQTTQGVSDVK